MSLFFDILIIFFLFVLFGVSHSFLASRKLKKLITEKVGSKIAFYRLFYNVSSFIIIAVLYEISPKPDLVIYDLPYPYDLIVFGLQVLSLVGFFWAASMVDGMEFLGIKQVLRYFKGNYKPDELDEHSTFIIKGPFKYSRHPIYFYSILLIGFRPAMNLWYLLIFIFSTIYFVAGSYYEERKLVKLFGVQYREYQKSVPRIFPYKIFNSKKFLVNDEI